VSAASCGRRGPDVRSDCWFEIEPRATGGVDLVVTSKVDFMYGEANRRLILEGLKYFGVKHARVAFEDSGAVPFVIMARLEACVRRLRLSAPGSVPEPWNPGTLEPSPSFARPSSKYRWRRSRLYLPGNEPKFMLTARVHQPDAVILDLEDSVPPADKDAALILVRNALRAIDFGDCERMVRINQLPAGLDEIEPLVHAGVNLILIPKCETAEQVREADARISSIFFQFGTRESSLYVWLMPIIETCQGMLNAAAIAKASPRVAALTYGLEDYLADLGGIKTPAGLESLWARSQVANAAKAAGLQAIDTVYADVADLAGLEASCRSARELGFEGKGCIHPRQVPVVNQAFTPSDSEIARATEIVLAFKDAQAKGKNVAVVGSKMIDPPVVASAQKTIELAIAAGKLAPDWDALSVTPSERGESRGLAGEIPPIATPSLRRNDKSREAK
jgi:citrate lyase subunit beta/citryl-CoA lyase